MALYRATQKLVNHIMAGRLMVVGIAGPATVASPAILAGADFRDLVDPVNRTFNLPAPMRPATDSVAGPPVQPTVRVSIDLAAVAAAYSVGLRSGPLFFNRNFEGDLPIGDNYATPVERTMVALGLIAPAGGLTDANIPAALNTFLAGLPVTGDPSAPR